MYHRYNRIKLKNGRLKDNLRKLLKMSLLQINEEQNSVEREPHSYQVDISNASQTSLSCRFFSAYTKAFWVKEYLVLLNSKISIIAINHENFIRLTILQNSPICSAIFKTACSQKGAFFEINNSLILSTKTINTWNKTQNSLGHVISMASNNPRDELDLEWVIYELYSLSKHTKRPKPWKVNELQCNATTILQIIPFRKAFTSAHIQ